MNVELREHEKYKIIYLLNKEIENKKEMVSTCNEKRLVDIIYDDMLICMNIIDKLNKGE